MFLYRAIRGDKGAFKAALKEIEKLEAEMTKATNILQEDRQKMLALAILEKADNPVFKNAFKKWQLRADEMEKGVREQESTSVNQQAFEARMMEIFPNPNDILGIVPVVKTKERAATIDANEFERSITGGALFKIKGQPNIENKEQLEKELNKLVEGSYNLLSRCLAVTSLFEKSEESNFIVSQSQRTKKDSKTPPAVYNFELINGVIEFEVKIEKMNILVTPSMRKYTEAADAVIKGRVEGGRVTFKADIIPRDEAMFKALLAMRSRYPTDESSATTRSNL
jgi:hypothetical protein